MKYVLLQIIYKEQMSCNYKTMLSMQVMCSSFCLLFCFCFDDIQQGSSKTRVIDSKAFAYKPSPYYVVLSYFNSKIYSKGSFKVSTHVSLYKGVTV